MHGAKRSWRRSRAYSPRVGYRPPEQVLAVIRPFLSYPRIDELSQTFLELVAGGGSAHATFQELLAAAALELAEPAEDKKQPTTLRLTRELLLEPDERLPDAERAPLLVLERDDEGNAQTSDPAAEELPPPFRVVGRGDSAERDPTTGLALTTDGQVSSVCIKSSRIGNSTDAQKHARGARHRRLRHLTDRPSRRVGLRCPCRSRARPSGSSWRS